MPTAPRRQRDNSSFRRGAASARSSSTSGSRRTRCDITATAGSRAPSRSRRRRTGRREPHVLLRGRPQPHGVPAVVPCFSTFLTNTRTLAVDLACAKDFASASIDTCGSSRSRSRRRRGRDAVRLHRRRCGSYAGDVLAARRPSRTTRASCRARTRCPETLTARLAFSPRLRRHAVLHEAAAGLVLRDRERTAGRVGRSTASRAPPRSGHGVTFDGAKVNITLGFLGNVECTYVNKRQPQVRVVKVLDPATTPASSTSRSTARPMPTRSGTAATPGSSRSPPVSPSPSASSRARARRSGTTSRACPATPARAAPRGTSHSFSVALRRPGHLHDHEHAQGHDRRREADPSRRLDAAVLVHAELRRGVPALRRPAEHVGAVSLRAATRCPRASRQAGR